MLYSGDDYYGEDVTSPLERPAPVRQPRCFVELSWSPAAELYRIEEGGGMCWRRSTQEVVEYLRACGAGALVTPPWSDKEQAMVLDLQRAGIIVRARD